MPTSFTHTHVQKTFFSGTHRARKPEETWARIKPLFGRFGITRVSDVTGLDCIGIPVCNAMRPNSRSLSVSQGKGIELPNARVSAAMEAIELYHAERPPPIILRETFMHLDPQVAVDLLGLSLLPRRGAEVDETLINWTSGQELISGKAILVPHDVVACDLTPRAPSDGVFLTSSNGLGSGNNLVEAMLHAVCETLRSYASEMTTLWLFDPHPPKKSKSPKEIAFRSTHFLFVCVRCFQVSPGLGPRPGGPQEATKTTNIAIIHMEAGKCSFLRCF